MGRKKEYDFIVYKTTEITTGMIYIGYDSYNRFWYYGSGTIMSRVIRNRFKDYIENILNENFENIKYGVKVEYLKKYGTNLFIKEVLEYYETKESMIIGEDYWVEKFNARDRSIGYNILPGGGKFGDTITNNPNRNEIIKNMHRPHSNKNIPLSESHKKNIGLGNKGKNTGKTKSLEQKMYLSVINRGEKNSFYNKHHTEETKQKLRLLREKKVYQYDKEINLIHEYKSALDASNITGICYADIVACCNDKYKTAGGSIWKYELIKDNDIELMKKYIKPKNLKKIGQFDKNNNLINKFNSMNEASKITGICATNISACCRNLRKFAGGSIWKYL